MCDEEKVREAIAMVVNLKKEYSDNIYLMTELEAIERKLGSSLPPIRGVLNILLDDSRI